MPSSQINLPLGIIFCASFLFQIYFACTATYSVDQQSFSFQQILQYLTDGDIYDKKQIISLRNYFHIHKTLTRYFLDPQKDEVTLQFIIESLFTMKEGILESALRQTYIMDPFSNRKRKRKMEFYTYEGRDPPERRAEAREASARNTLIEVDEKRFSPLRAIEMKNRINGWVEPFQLQDKKAATFRLRRLSKNRQEEMGSAENREALSPDRIKHLKTILKKLQTPQRVQEAVLAEQPPLSSSREEHEVQIITLPPRRAEAPSHASTALRVAKKKVINYSAYKQNHCRRLAESICFEPQQLRGTLIIKETGRKRDLRG